MAKKSKTKHKNANTAPAVSTTEPTQSRWLQYLDEYNNNKQQFKFRKVVQYQLIKHTYNKLLLSKQYFTIFLEYINNIQGKSKQMLIDAAQLHIESFESKKYDDKDEHDVRRNYKRAKQIINVLVK